MSAQTPATPHPPVDRQKTTPFLLKLFYKSHSFHRVEDFTPTSQPAQHVQIYTWPTCTLRELTQLLASALPTLLPSPAAGTRLAFRLVFPDARTATHAAPGTPGRFIAKELGSVVVGAEGEADGELLGEPDKSLQDARFVVGDYIVCAVYPPLANGEVAPPPVAPSGGVVRGYGGGGPPPVGGRGGGRGGGVGPPPPAPRDYGGGRRGGYSSDWGRGMPSGEWRRGERLPDAPSYGGYRERGRGRGAW